MLHAYAGISKLQAEAMAYIRTWPRLPYHCPGAAVWQQRRSLQRHRVERLVLLARLAALLCIPAVTLAVVNPAVRRKSNG